jgi:hypothetical protein
MLAFCCFLLPIYYLSLSDELSDMPTFYYLDNVRQRFINIIQNCYGTDIP